MKIIPELMRDLQQRLYRVEKQAGWDPDDVNTFGEEIAHLHDEVSEAFRWFRKHKNFEMVFGEDGKPEGVPAEFADVVIGLAYLAERFGFDLFDAVEVKSGYNASRSYADEGRRLHEPEDVERDYEGHVIGQDGLVDGPGGQRLKPVVDPWPGINSRRQAEGSA